MPQTKLTPDPRHPNTRVAAADASSIPAPNAMWRLDAANAVGLCAAGVSMALLPRLAPSFFTRIGPDGHCARVVWAELMAAVNLTFGGAYFLRRGAAQAASLVAGFRRGAVSMLASSVRFIRRRKRAAAGNLAHLATA